MIFASPVFLFYFLPAFLALYYLTPGRWKSATILLGSSVFYAWWRADFLLLLYGIIGFSWLIGLGLEKWRRRELLWFGVVANLLILGYFKYWNFSVNSFFAIFAQAGTKPPPALVHVILPIGVSFFVFHAISYIVDVWRKDTPATKSLTDFAAFIMLFPHLIAGPVLKYKDLSWQFKNRRHSMALFSEGAYRFMAGFAKKVLIADSVAPLADTAFALDAPTMTESWLGLAAYTMQLYFDFSGYSEMAVGLALMMGFRFIENFNMPYISKSITEFWQRWHISLSTWLREYLYIPLGGNRKGHGRTYFNLFITMLLGGLWHGANWTFILWGAWHGGLLAAERFRKETSNGSPVPALLARVYCILAVVLGWVLFRATDIGAALAYYKGMAGMNGAGLTPALTNGMKGLSLVALAGGLALTAIQPLFARWRVPVELSKGSIAMESRPPVSLQLFVGALFLIAVSRLIAMSYSPFLYFQF
jgi:alginate O-acetyltransferase complex protein AlgI